MKEQTRPAALSGRFGDVPVDARMAGTLTQLGYSHPTPIQQQAIPPLREGRDVIGLARTGSGKTAGFGIPLIESIRPAEQRVQALVLVPTRELAAQVTQELTRLGTAHGVRTVAVYGGVSMGAQITALRGNAHVVVGTPGRVIDHLTRGTMNLGHTRLVVLDEADRMLDVGFAPAIDDILRRVPGPRQVSLFSATFPAEVESLAARHTRDAMRVAVDQPGTAIETLEQRFQRVPEGKEKIDVLHDVLIAQECGLALVFRRTTHRTDKLARDLERRGFRVAALHGRRTQGQRERALEALRKGQLQVLVATDIAARGLDIAGLTHVVNFDLPDTAENYTHRIGRTARMGAGGIAITLIGPEDEEALRSIQRRLPSSAGRGTSPTQAPQTPATPRRESPRRSRGHQPAHGAVHQGALREPVATTEQRPRGSERDAATRRPTAAPPRGSQPPRRIHAGSVPGAESGDGAWYPFQLPDQPLPWRSGPAAGRGVR